VFSGEHGQIRGHVLCRLANLRLHQGRLEEAGDLLAGLEQHEDAVRPLAALARGKLCVVTGTGDAWSCLHDALRYFGQARLPVDAARTQLELAKALASTTPAAAIAHANAALESFHRLRADRDADAASAVLRSLGVAARSGVRARAQLTRRESEVLELVGHGLSNAEIGERLFITPKTVEHHVGRILAKLGLPSRARALAYAVASSDRAFGP
jgi:DNA-binding CsgD family transcriptional regulator